MAGEIEEPFSVQLASLHSGSISFGRFEAESLSWERRSSFSHNKYLEEVEKYSTPGSVTQKKAYFEAHFKKKALLRQSSELQNGMEDQTSSNDILDDDMSYIDEFVHSNKDSYLPNDEKTTDGSDYHGGCEVLNNDRESEEISPSDFHMEPPVIDVTEVADGGCHCFKPVDPQKTQLEHDAIVLDKDNSELELKDNLPDEAENTDGTDPSPKFQDIQKEHALSMKKAKEPNLKGLDRGQLKTAKIKVRSRAIGLVQRKMSSEITKDSAKNSKIGERESVPKTKTEKQLRQKVPPNATSLTGSVKSKDSKNLNAKSSQENKSDKDERAKRVGALPVPQHSASDKSEPRSCQSTNRSKRSAISTKSEAKSSSAVFSFRSDQRAEKRKEFFMKLEEKMHAKEAEMNQMQARTQEVTEAEIKQLRRSLNFKATPMPSFYHETVPRGSEGKKVASAHAKSSNSQSKSVSPGSRPVRSPACRKESSVTESTNPAQQSQESKPTMFPTLVPSECGDCAPTTSTNKSHSPSTSKKTETAGKKEREKGKNADVQKQQRTVVSKVSKGERAEMMRKMKGPPIDGSSGMGCLSVGVAS